MRLVLLASVILSTALATGACGGGEEEGAPTGATCPQGSTLTYDNFAANFFATYCTACHSSELQGADRNGAPADHNFDTLAGVVAEMEHVDQAAAAGPDSVNTVMPPDDADDFPAEDERLDLGEWLACGAPN